MRLAVLPALLFLPAAAGCGLLVHERPDVNRPFPDPWQPAPEPQAFAFEGEIRDFVTWRPEPGAVLETWTEDPGYAPKAKIDERGRFSVRFDTCRREGTTGDAIAGAVATAILFGPAATPAGNCRRSITRFGFRARLGTRCSLAYRNDSPPPKDGKPFVLWLRPCDEVEAVPRRPGAGG